MSGDEMPWGEEPDGNAFRGIYYALVILLNVALSVTVGFLVACMVLNGGRL